MCLRGASVLGWEGVCFLWWEGWRQERGWRCRGGGDKVGLEKRSVNMLCDLFVMDQRLRWSGTEAFRLIFVVEGR